MRYSPFTSKWMAATSLTSPLMSARPVEGHSRTQTVLRARLAGHVQEGQKTGTVSHKSLLRLSLVHPARDAVEDSRQEQSQASPFSGLPVSRRVAATVSSKSLLRLPSSLSWVVPMRNRNSLKRAPSRPSRVQTYEMPEKTAMGSSFIHISPLLPAFLSWVVRAKEEDNQEQSHANFSPRFPVSLPQAAPKKAANRISLSLLIAPCVSPVSDAGQEREEEQSQSNLSS